MPVRSAQPADIDTLAELAADTFPLACPPHLSQQAIAGFIKDNLSPSCFTRYLQDVHRVLLVEETNGRLRGYAMLVLDEPSDPDVAAAVTTRPTAELSKCYVASEHHGTGIAGNLITACFDAARHRGARSIWLGTNESNIRAITFYTRHGFAPAGRRSFLVGDRKENDIVLERLLA